MSSLKLIALDLDGTTLATRDGSTGMLTERTRRILDKIAKKGVEIVVASGRAYSALPAELLGMDGVNYAIVSNGAAVYRVGKDEILFDCAMAEENVVRIVEQAAQIPAQAMEIVCGGNSYIEKSYLENMGHYGLKEWWKPFLQSGRMHVDDIFRFAREKKAAVENIGIYVRDERAREAWLEKLARIDGLYVTSSEKGKIEISDSRAGKDEALRRLTEYLHILPEETVAFGNAENDMGMLQFAGIGVAVANSPDEVKRAADRITASNNEDGVAIALEELFA